MSSATTPTTPTTAAPPVKLDYFAALLSYLVPGLGQIKQGRFAKGLLFLVSLYSLFFYGMVLGSFQNVYLPDNHAANPGTISRLWNDVYTRFQFVGQCPLGIAVWPAIYQYRAYDPKHDNEEKDKVPLKGFMRAPSTDRLNELQRNGDKTWDLGWVYTVIAGVLNVLVIYDALAGPAFREVKSQAALPGQPQGGTA